MTPYFARNAGNLSESELKFRLESSFERDSGDVASERLKHARFGNNMTVLEVKETACALADEKQQKRKKKEKKGDGREKNGGGALRDRADALSPVCRFVSRERCCVPSSGKLLMPNLPLGRVCAWLGAQWSGCPSHILAHSRILSSGGSDGAG